MEWLPRARAEVCLAAGVVQGLLLASGTATLGKYCRQEPAEVFLSVLAVNCLLLVLLN